MKSVPLIDDFDGARFIARHGLDPTEVWVEAVDGVPMLFYPDRLGDSPRQETRDVLDVRAEIDSIKARLATLESRDGQ